MDQATLLLILIIITMYEACPGSFRKNWQGNVPLITSMEIAMNNEMDFIQLSRFNLSVFQERIIAPANWILNQPVNRIVQWLHDEDVPFILPVNERHRKLSVEDRVLRSLILCGNHTVKLLEMLFGQKKSTIYEDAWLIMKVYCKLWCNKLDLPLKGSVVYLAKVGMGVLGDAFPTAVYI